MTNSQMTSSASKSPSSSRTAKTSIDILHERDALETRLRIVEASVNAIGHETEHALRNPDIAILTLCRIAALVRQTRAV